MLTLAELTLSVGVCPSCCLSPTQVRANTRPPSRWRASPTHLGPVMGVPLPVNAAWGALYEPRWHPPRVFPHHDGRHPPPRVFPHQADVTTPHGNDLRLQCRNRYPARCATIAAQPFERAHVQARLQQPREPRRNDLSAARAISLSLIGLIGVSREIEIAKLPLLDQC